ncbi:MAG: ABC transporter ATP-binding protein [Ignavibacteriae bacterium]|nr:ABC transporter ATP-binding protein [Ignavibacteriota bacterium]NOG96338.1 ABC transporter ATP-binding protein [Ignavibacteriota bacterium]
MLKISNISKRFGRIDALKNIDLEIEQGEFFGLLGPNGAGKSTLMDIIIGYHKPDTGTLFFENEIIIPEKLVTRYKFGYVPQEISLYQELSAHQNLKIFGSIYKMSSKELDRKIAKVLELVKLSERKNDTVKDFSGGMKRRLNLAASILHDPQIILCDEPTVGIDPQSRNAIFDMLHQLNQNGKTIIYTTHYMEEAERLCSKLAIIDEGKIIANGSLNDLIKLSEKRETIRVRKTSGIISKADFLKSLGDVIELDYYFEIRTEEKGKQNSELFLNLEKEGIPPELIELRKSSLEDVFLNLTGRSLRD